jgi:hypothetical protein
MSEAWRNNTVEAKNQLKDTDLVTFINPEGSPKFMFLGNSITKHAPKEEIGWYGDYGMAASCEENDYVHVMMAAIRKKYPNASFCITQGWRWEAQYWDDSSYHYFEVARDYAADVLFFRIGDNVRYERLDEGHDLVTGTEDYLKFLCAPHTKVIYSTCFWTRKPVDEKLREVAARAGKPIVELGDLGDNPKMRAVGLFEHAGVAWHPGDEGMRNLAERLLAAWEKEDN